MKKQEAGFLNNTLVKILNGMALGLMASLVTGVILKQIGTYLNIQELIIEMLAHQEKIQLNLDYQMEQLIQLHGLKI